MKNSLRAEAYNAFMGCLLNRELKPGRLVSQRELAALTDCSLSSVREALKRIEAEGIVELIPKRGVLIKEVKRKEIDDAYQLRILIEGQAVKIFARDCSPSEIQELRQETQEIIDHNADSAEGMLEQLTTRVQLDRKLHRRIVSALDNKLVTDIFTKIETTMLLARLGLPIQFLSHGTAFHEHLILLDALEKNDVNAAVIAINDHLNLARERAIQSVEF